MKGRDTVYAFLEANESKGDLPSLPATEADRLAILTVAMELFKRVKTLESTSSKSTTQSHLMVTASPFVPKGTTSSEKPEEEKLCPSMWGKRECEGTDQGQCKRLHLTLCSQPNCFINTEKRKSCKQWHGHLRAAIRQEKAKERAEVEKRQFATWKKNKSSGNGGKGQRGAPLHQHKPQEHKKQREGYGLKNLQRREFKPTPKPRQLQLGDYIPAPLPAVPAWGPTWRQPRAPTVATATAAPVGQTGTNDLRQQIQQMLQMLLQSGVF